MSGSHVGAYRIRPAGPRKVAYDTPLRAASEGEVMQSVWRSAIKILPLMILAAATITTLAGCEAANSAPAAIFRPEAPGATAIHNLSLILLGMAAVVLVGVEVTLFLAILRFRNRPESSAVQTHGNLRLETGWTVATSLAVVVILVLTVKTMAEATAVPEESPLLASAFPGDTLMMRVVGHQWWWTFEYPGLDIVTANEVYVPVGKAIKVQLEADDVIHSFWAPRLGGKVDTIPGTTNYTSFLAAQPGVYQGLCAEFCGDQHAHMSFRIAAVPSAEFSAWVRAQQAVAAPPATEAERAGAQAFVESCGSCHTVKGTEASGKLGPDLTHVASRTTLAGGTVENTPANLRAWLRDPQAVKRGNRMPGPDLDQATIEQLVAYLNTLR